MFRCFFIVALVLALPFVAAADLLVPSVDLRVFEKAPLLATWAHAGGKAAIRCEATDPQSLTCNIYQVEGGVVLPLSRDVALEPLKPGSNLIEIPLPERSERGKLLLKIAASPDGQFVANLMVDVLPKNAWDGFSNQAKVGKVFIDPTLRAFHAWAGTHGISSTAAAPGKPAEFHFGKPAGDPNGPLPGRFILFERDAPDAFPVIEVLSSPEVTKILLPPGFLEELPNSATAQALLLKHLKLLP